MVCEKRSIAEVIQVFMNFLHLTNTVFPRIASSSCRRLFNFEMELTVAYIQRHDTADGFPVRLDARELYARSHSRREISLEPQRCLVCTFNGGKTVVPPLARREQQGQSIDRVGTDLRGRLASPQRRPTCVSPENAASLQRELEDSDSLNWSWCEPEGTLHAMKNAGQSNCLLDAISLYMWGVRDNDLVLRTALYNTMARSCPADLRLISHGADQRAVTSEDWGRAVKMADPKARATTSVDNPYQHIHLFLLANIIRRAIIVVGGSIAGKEVAAGLDSNPGPLGIYLPWLWERADCHPYPVVLGSMSPWQHFVPLVTAGSAQEQAEGAVLPLVRGTPQGLRELVLRFPPDQEEGSHQRYLRAYLKLRAIQLGQLTIYAARLKGHNLPEPLSLVQDYFRLANHACGQRDQEVSEPRESRREEWNGPPLPPPALPTYPPSSSSSSSSSPFTAFSITGHKCATDRCLYFASKFTWPLCHGCHGTQQHRPEGRGFSSSGDSFCRDTPPRVQPDPGPSSAPSAPSRPSFQGDLVSKQWPGDPEGRPTRGSAVTAGGAEESDFLCGRCLTCKREMRTFNGLCFQCLQSRTGPPPSPGPTSPVEMTRALGGEEKPCEGERCLTPGCVYFGTPKQAGYCTFCYCNQNQTPPPAPTPTNTPLSSTLRNLPRCSGHGCEMLGNPTFRGLCERCFLVHYRGTIEPQAPGALAGRQGGDQLSGRYHRPQAKPDPPGERAEKKDPMEMTESPTHSLGNAQASAKTDRPRPCQGRGCTNFGNSRCNGLCNSCYKNHVD
ncbi:hypothetical protein AAFF_G00185170 [Aldrovandia affinis]|uniref:ubiquitinyl hydrolase 1 n=1 Tax=Aldrovandia affinis TaxID=143900 RepID=A0AAD7RK07_9TELE|nr:hypothetical protein AAFF_G00185170 [Aldrovandia affinis]